MRPVRGRHRSRDGDKWRHEGRKNNREEGLGRWAPEPFVVTWYYCPVNCSCGCTRGKRGKSESQTIRVGRALGRTTAKNVHWTCTPRHATLRRYVSNRVLHKWCGWGVWKINQRSLYNGVFFYLLKRCIHDSISDGFFLWYITYIYSKCMGPWWIFQCCEG
jgi:hypothetical protein